MNKIIFIAVMIFACAQISAQTSDIYTRLNTADSINHNSVTINEEASIKNIATTNSTPTNSIRGYRVRIFFDNGQSARTLAQQVQEEFISLYPNIACNLIYENPYFKVTAGNCLSEEEAIMLWDKINKSFDKAFIIREDIPFEALKPVQPVDTTPEVDSLELSKYMESLYNLETEL